MARTSSAPPTQSASVAPPKLTGAQIAKAERERKAREAIVAKEAARLARERKAEEAKALALAKEMEPKWRLVERFSGSSIKNTSNFDIKGEEWRIRWSTEPGKYGDMNFQIYVHDASDDSLKDLAANVIGAASDESVIRGAGRYYLKLNTSQPYEVIVEEFR